MFGYYIKTSKFVHNYIVHRKNQYKYSINISGVYDNFLIELQQRNKNKI